MAFRNYTEDLVIEELCGVLEQLPRLCKCERCRGDMVAYALNRMPAKYVVTELGSIYTKAHQLKAQVRADAVVQLMAASKVVKKKPRH